MNKMINKPLEGTVADSIVTLLNDAITQVEPFNAPLTDEQRKGGRTMAEGREGMVRLMSNIAVQHINSLPRNEEPQQMVDLLNAYTQASKALQPAMQLHEILLDTQTATGMDLMVLFDRYSQHLQAARNGNTALDAAMNEIDEYNKRFGRTTTPNEEDTPPIS